MKVEHISLLSHGGASVAASRISKAIHGEGVPSTVKWITNDFSTSEAIINKIGKKLDYEVSSGGFINGSFFKSLGVGSYLKKANFSEEAILNLHWVPGKVTDSMASILRNKNVVFTLHDMNVFTGFCHHSGACSNFESGCSNCPQIIHPLRGEIFKCQQAKREVFNSFENISFISPSSWLAKQASKSEVLNGKKIWIIRNPIPLEIYFPRNSKERKNYIKIGILGSNSDKSKGVARIIPVISALLNELKDVNIRLLVLGETHDQIESQIQIPVNIYQDDVLMSEALSDCDLFLYSSLYENFPSLLCEAQACGVPVVAVDAGGVSETFLHDKTGILVNEKLLNLKDTLATLIQNKHRLSQMSRDSRLFAESEFGESSVGQKYIEVYENVFRN